MFKSPSTTYITEKGIVFFWFLPNKSLKICLSFKEESYYKKVWSLNQKEVGSLKDLTFENIDKFLKT